ncbi:DctP family TRAP transporter solute-binding subunit [Neobacillus citreus]|uniref:DctP family TRAP transporter solute-binding subunit n=1 Tax=Neobacillus citreus TaxID=2833578 RepID=A0A942SVQ1_9BACI|nr:DctP family TRAP transporter solute-binding subunit [Neobacillus citreus]MCH6266139.1 DctP family TRAP transporter solute-binding subunit [Neobacillus citreus]
MQITIGHLNPPGSAYDQGAKVFKQILERMTDGQIKVRIISGLNLSGIELIRAVQTGEYDIGITSSSSLGNLVPIVNAFDFPYLFRSHEHAYRVLDGEIGDFVNEEIDLVGLKNLAWWENGYLHITTAETPIIEPENLRGLKIRTMDNQIHRTLFHVWGANPVSVPYPQLYEALRNGTVDGQENSLGNIVPNRFYEVQRELTLTGHIYNPALFVMNKGKYDHFSLDIKIKISDASRIARDFERDFLRRNNPIYLQIAHQNEMHILTETDIDFPAFVRTSKKVYTQLGEPYKSIPRKIRAL